jgi:hypothetical protein
VYLTDPADNRWISVPITATDTIESIDVAFMTDSTPPSVAGGDWFPAAHDAGQMDVQIGQGGIDLAEGDYIVWPRPHTQSGAVVPQPAQGYLSVRK